MHTLVEQIKTDVGCLICVPAWQTCERLTTHLAVPHVTVPGLPNSSPSPAPMEDELEHTLVVLFHDSRKGAPQPTEAELSQSIRPISKHSVRLQRGRRLCCVRRPTVWFPPHENCRDCLKAFYRSLDLTYSEGDNPSWGRMLLPCRPELQSARRTHLHTGTSVNSSTRQLYHFMGMKDAWRNPTMHVESTYSMEVAEAIVQP